MRFTIQRKIQVYILGTTIVVYLVVFGYLSISFLSTDYKNLKTQVDEQSKKYAALVAGDINEELSKLRTLSHVLTNDGEMSRAGWAEDKNRDLRNVFNSTHGITSLWDSWENSALAGGSGTTGRTLHTISKLDGSITETTAVINNESSKSIYNLAKASKREGLSEPYFSAHKIGNYEKTMLATAYVPVVRNEQVVGVLAEELILNEFQTLLNSFKTYDESYAMIVSEDMHYAVHFRANVLGKRVDSVLKVPQGLSIKDSIKAGKLVSFSAVNTKGVMNYYSYAPIELGKDKSCRWVLVMAVPESELKATAQGNFFIAILISLLGLGVLLGVIIILSKKITTPIIKLTDNLKQMSRGMIDASMKQKHASNDEIAEMEDALNTTIDGLIVKSKFANEIGAGHLDAHLELLSNDDLLGKSLLMMRDDLLSAQHEESKRNEVEKHRQWIVEGIAHINTIIRVHNGDLDSFCKEILKGIVTYLGANQGGMFVRDEIEFNLNSEYLLKAAFAYNRQKLLKKSIKAKEGILGACIFEKESIYLKEIPEEYLQITSGLGEANPRNILITPLIQEGDVLGVIELASFTEFSDYQMEFVNKSCESIASALYSARRNSLTQKLLADSQVYAEQMAAQEEEMRQNLEELSSTQEEIGRQRQELNMFVKALEHSCFFAEYDAHGMITNVSEMYASFLGLTKNDLIGYSLRADFAKYLTEREYDELVMKLQQGSSVVKRVSRTMADGSSHTFEETYSPIIIDGMLDKFIKVSFDVSETTK